VEPKSFDVHHQLTASHMRKSTTLDLACPPLLVSCHLQSISLSSSTPVGLLLLALQAWYAKARPYNFVLLRSSPDLKS